MSDSNDAESKKEMEKRIHGLEDRMNQVESKLSKLRDKLDEVGSKMDSLLGSSDPKNLIHLEKMVEEFEKSMRRSVSAIRRRQKDLEMKVNKKYVPRLEKEEGLLKDLKQGIKEVRDRLTTYGRMQQKLHKLYEQMDKLETEVIGKLGRTEFEEHKREMDENIRRLKSQLDMLS